MRIELDYEPQEKQLLLHTSPARLILYGGAVGGGKSAALRMGEAVGWCVQVPGIQVYLFRRTLAELEGTHIKPLKAALPAELASYNETKKNFEFANGSAIICCYCEREADVNRYQSEEMHVLLIDETSHLTDYQINYLITRNRLGGFQTKVPEQYRGLLPRAVFASNPGGPGHSTLKARFIDPAPEGAIFTDKVTKRPTQFIRAVMADNAFIEADYKFQVDGLPPELAKALKEGDWDAVVGAAVHNLSRDRHMLWPFSPPRHWTKFMSVDWGTARPFSVGWYTVADGDIELEWKRQGQSRLIPAGAVIRYREWYGWNGRPNQGCRMDSQQVARKILEKEGDEVMDYRIGDSQMWASHDGPSVQETMFNATGGRVVLSQAKKDRKACFAELISRLAGNPDFLAEGEEDEPMFYATSDCTHFWRTVPVLTLDEHDPDKGPDTKLEDHVYDDVVYALRSRPYISTEEMRWQAEWGEESARARGQVDDPYAV